MINCWQNARKRRLADALWQQYYYVVKHTPVCVECIKMNGWMHVCMHKHTILSFCKVVLDHHTLVHSLISLRSHLHLRIHALHSTLSPSHSLIDAPDRQSYECVHATAQHSHLLFNVHTFLSNKGNWTINIQIKIEKRGEKKRKKEINRWTDLLE